MFLDIRALNGGKLRGLRISLLATAFTFLIISALPGCSQAQVAKTEKNQTIDALYRASGAFDSAKVLAMSMVGEVKSRLSSQNKPAVMEKFDAQISQVNWAVEAEQTVTDALGKTLSPEQVTFLLNFYQSEAGKKSLASNKELAAAGQTAMRTQIVPYLQKLREEAAGGPPAGVFQPEDLKSKMDAIPKAKADLIARMTKFTHPATSVRDGLIRFEESQQALLKSDSKVTDAEKTKLLAVSNSYIKSLNTRVNWSGALEPIFAIEFNRLFSQDDLQTLVAFYEAPAQEAASSKMSEALTQAFQSLQKVWGEKIVKIAEQSRAAS